MNTDKASSEPTPGTHDFRSKFERTKIYFEVVGIIGGLAIGLLAILQFQLYTEEVASEAEQQRISNTLKLIELNMPKLSVASKVDTASGRTIQVNFKFDNQSQIAAVHEFESHTFESCDGNTIDAVHHPSGTQVVTVPPLSELSKTYIVTVSNVEEIENLKGKLKIQTSYKQKLPDFLRKPFAYLIENSHLSNGGGEVTNLSDSLFINSGIVAFWFEIKEGTFLRLKADPCKSP